MSARSPAGRPIIGRPRRNRTVGESINQRAVETASTRPDLTPNGDDKFMLQYSSHMGTVGAGIYQTAVGTASTMFGLRHREDENDFVPRVPRIPDKFQSRGIDHNSAPRWGMPQTPEGKGTDLQSIPGPHTRYLPNCSYGQAKEVQVISNAMMQAYVAMRGNHFGVQDGNDPLFKWIQQREELAKTSRPKIDEEKDVSRMLELIDNALLSATIGDSPRDSVFEVYRPDFAHIKPPRDMDLSPHTFAASCNDFEPGDSDADDGDEEAGGPSGRISPCTFLEWSKGCVRWNGNDSKQKMDTSSFQRMRPATPETPASPQLRQPKPDHPYVIQTDIHTGEELTPTYSVSTNPSILYTPPGIDFRGFRNAGFLAQYRRMTPLLERELRKELYGGVGELPKLSDDGKESFSASEVEAAVVTVPEVANCQSHEVEAMIQDRWTTVHRIEKAGKTLYKHMQGQKQHLKRLRYDKEHMREYLPALRQQRETRQEKLRERGETIRGYVAENARDAQSRLDSAWQDINEAQAKISANALRIANLEYEIRELCTEAGVRDPRQAYEVLVGKEPDPVFERGANGDDDIDGFVSYYPYDSGVLDIGPLGFWSASSIDRAPQDFERLKAEREREAAAAANDDVNGVEDDETYNGGDDSAVSGIGSRRTPSPPHDDLDDAGCF